jgi:hypothetical protein
MNSKGKGGFGDRPESERRENARKAGSIKNPKKGFGSMTEEQRKDIARKGVEARRRNKQAE